MGTIRFIYKPTGLGGSAPAPETRPAAPDSVPAVATLERVKVDRWWRESSYDLWQGLEVREDPPDTMPAQWLDEFDLAAGGAKLPPKV
ncbi:MAG: hypothetical protein HS128_20265 [Ideonella sp.]|nr:hypothetical protein [Ideonella sp.]MCC7458829.1 hypothetical protein [Nitrospira sp.]